MKNIIIHKEKQISMQELVDILKKLFKKHIGENRGIAIQEILNELFPEVNNWIIWKQIVYTEIIRKAIVHLRCSQGILIISRSSMYFIPNTQEEVDYYKNCLKRNIKQMKRSIIKADSWIEEGKWKRI